MIAELLAALSNVFFIFISYLFISFRHVSMYEYFLQYRIANGGTSRVNSPQFSCPKTALQIESRLEFSKIHSTANECFDFQYPVFSGQLSVYELLIQKKQVLLFIKTFARKSVQCR